MDKQQRNYRLFIEAGQRTFEQVAAGVPMGPTIEIDPPFTLEFEVDRNALSSANTSAFRVYNLAASTRKQIYKDRYATNTYKGVELKAGYGDVIPTIFKGNIKQAWSVREGTNFLTKIEAYDGGFAFINGQTNQSFDAGTPKNQVLDAILGSLPNVNKGAVGNFPGVLTRGNAISGNSADLARQYSNGGFFVDLERAYCLGDSECIQGAIQTIDSAAGLLSTPLREETILTFDMIFEPRLLIGQLVNLQSITNQNFQGPHKVISLHHRGLISESVCGSATTSVGLWVGPEILKVVNS